MFQRSGILRSSLLPMVLLFGLASCAAAADAQLGWRRDGSGNFPAAKPPTRWSSETNAVWNSKMPGRSISSPVAVAGKVFTVSQPAELICVNADSGEIEWQRAHDYADIFDSEKAAKIAADLKQANEVREQIDAIHREQDEARKEQGEKFDRKPFEERIHKLEEQRRELTAYPEIPDGTPGNTTSTPISDGKTVWAVFGTGIVSAHTLDGERRWARFVKAPRDRHSASPLLIGNLLIVDFRGLSALNAKTGETVWEAETNSRAGTPVAAKVDGKDVIVTPSGSIIAAADGAVLAKDLFSLDYCSPIVHEDVVYAVENGTTKAIRLSPAHDGKVQSEVLWETRSARDDRLASPVYHHGLLYSATGKGILEVLDAKTGDLVYRQRLSQNEGRVDPSLAIAGDLLFVSTNRGNTLVLKTGRKFGEVAQNELKEEFSSSPTFSGNRIYIRTEKQLYCLGE